MEPSSLRLVPPRRPSGTTVPCVARVLKVASVCKEMLEGSVESTDVTARRQYRVDDFGLRQGLISEITCIC